MEFCETLERINEELELVCVQVMLVQKVLEGIMALWYWVAWDRRIKVIKETEVTQYLKVVILWMERKLLFIIKVFHINVSPLIFTCVLPYFNFHESFHEQGQALFMSLALHSVLVNHSYNAFLEHFLIDDIRTQSEKLVKYWKNFFVETVWYVRYEVRKHLQEEVLKIRLQL